MSFRFFAFAAVSVALAACAARPQTGVVAPIPPLVLEEALTGRTIGDGVMIDSVTGEETMFSLVINGEWDGKVLTLVEDFLYSDGSKDQKTWRLTKVSDNRYTGTRDDVVGMASAFRDGSGVRFEYVRNMDTHVGKLDLTLRDLWYMQADGSVRSVAVVSKYGVRVARLELTLRRDGSGS